MMGKKQSTKFIPLGVDMLDGHVIRVSCKVKNLKEYINRAWYEADAKKYPHA